jgi:hypothetical protein
VTGHRLGTILAFPHVFRPAYLELLASGVLDERVDAAWAHLGPATCVPAIAG